VSLGRLGWFFLRLGTLGFGGPLALAGAMQRILVEERGWFSRDEYIEGLALAQLSPGPLAAQLAMYLGYVRAGIAGATVVGVAFVLPSLLIVWMLAAAYVRFDGLWWMQSLFYGVGAAAIGIIAKSVMRIGRLTLARDRMLWAIALLLALTTALTGRENVWLFLLGGFAPIVARRATGAPAFVLAGAGALGAAAPAWAGSAAGTSLVSLAWFFTRAGAFVFGSGLAIVPFLYGGVVQEHRWLTDRQFVDAIAVAMITPGPVVITVAFIGYLVRGTAGMLVAAMGVFLPVYIAVVVAAPAFRRYHTHPAIRLFVGGVTAAATGALAGAAVLLAQRALVDWWTIAIAAATLLATTVWRISELWLIAIAGVMGLCLR
jgi:chromate transporter